MIYNSYRNGKMHAEEWDVVVWLYPTGWSRPGQPAHQEYRFHCIGSRYGGKFSLDSLEANRQQPPLDNLTRPVMVQTITAELALAVGIPVRQWPASLILWAQQDAPAYMPCPYRHEANTGYAPVQLQLLKAAV